MRFPWKSFYMYIVLSLTTSEKTSVTIQERRSSAPWRSLLDLWTFGTVSLASFLKPNLPCTARESLTSIMRSNLSNYEKLIRDKIEAGDVTPGTLVVCELDRAFGKKYSPSMTVGRSPCLKTQLKYLFVISTDDLQLPDAQRAYFRWILPQERCALQGVHPSLALHLCNSDLLHALGNAYPVPLIVACGMPVLQMIERWGPYRPVICSSFLMWRAISCRF